MINQRIDPEVDTERDFIGVNLTEASSVTEQQYLHGVAPVFEAQTSSGEAYHSDGRILLLDLHQIALARTGLPAQSSTIVGATSLPIAAPAESFLSNLRSPR